MSFFKKIFKTKDKSDDGEEGATSSHMEAPKTPPLDEKRRLRNNLSVSRSGRYKQKKRERSALFPKPELYDGTEQSSADRTTLNFNSDQSSQHRESHITGGSPNAYSRTSRGSRGNCREIETPNKSLTPNSSLSRRSAKV